ncbi:MAG: ECF RNA polymerase sigma factor SigR [Planctomycetes bacterium]|nr:ECF RNA polymerase sigma factor SigR [Planctomycetota bacterium]
MISAVSPIRKPDLKLVTVPGASPGAAGGNLSRDDFERMTTELSEPLFATALRLTRNRADAEDLVQDTLHRAWRALASFEKGSRFNAWIFRILRNAFLNRIRKARLAPEVTDPDTLDPADRAEVVPDIRSLRELPDLADRHFDERVKRALDSVPEVYRTPFLLFTLADMTYDEIASALEIPVGTVMSRLHRARTHLRERLQPYAAERNLAGDGA